MNATITVNGSKITGTVAHAGPRGIVLGSRWFKTVYTLENGVYAQHSRGYDESQGNSYAEFFRSICG